jgi:hypothetical protein
MNAHAAVTVLRPRDEVERLWHTTEHEQSYEGATVSFKDAPGDRGTEVHVELAPAGRVAGLLRRSLTRAQVKDDLRHFKQQLETGTIPRSEASPEGERFIRKFSQQPAQPTEEVGAR